MDIDSKTGRGRSQFEVIGLSAFFILSIAVHSLYMIHGLGEQDAGRIIESAVRWHSTGDVVSFYFRSSPLYVHIIKKLLDWGVPVHSLPSFVNWFNVAIGSVAIILLYLFWRQIIGWKAAAAGCLLLSFSPSFWLANIYGMPHLPAFALFIAALLFFSWALDSYGWLRAVGYGSALLCIAAASTFKADIILCSGAFLGVLIVGRKCTFRNVVGAGVIGSMGVLAPVFYEAAQSGPIGSQASFAASWSKTFPLSSNALLGASDGRILMSVNGPLIFFVAVLSITIFILRGKEHRRIALLALVWCLPAFLFWGLRFGNNARHLMMAFSVLPFLVAALLFSSGLKTFFPAALLAVLLPLNYFSLHQSGATARPSTRIFSSAGEIQKKVSYLHEKGKEFALWGMERKVFIGTWTNPYVLFEVMSNARSIQIVNRSDTFSPDAELMRDRYHELNVVMPGGQLQHFVGLYIQNGDRALDEARAYLRRGWSVWSMQYDLSCLRQG